MERLDPPVHHFGEASEVGDVAHLGPKLTQPGCGAAGRNNLDPMPRETGGKLVESGFVGKRNQRPFDKDQVSHWNPLVSFSPSLRGAKRRSNPVRRRNPGCFAALAMTPNCQLVRRNCQPISPPNAETSPITASCNVRCGRPRPSTPRLSSKVRLPPRQRKFHGGAALERRIAPMPSAVAVASTPGARWNRTA